MTCVKSLACRCIEYLIERTHSFHCEKVVSFSPCGLLQSSLLPSASGITCSSRTVFLANIIIPSCLFVLSVLPFIVSVRLLQSGDMFEAGFKIAFSWHCNIGVDNILGRLLVQFQSVSLYGRKPNHSHFTWKLFRSLNLRLCDRSRRFEQQEV